MIKTETINRHRLKHRREALETVVYDNYDTDALYEEAIENLIANEIYTEADKESGNIPETEIWDEVNLIDNVTWNDIYMSLCNFFDTNNSFIVKGTIGRWNGNYDGYKIVNDFKQTLNCIGNCDYITIKDVGGELCIKGIHHDGENYISVRTIADKGNHYYHNWENSNDNREEYRVLDKIWNSYSRKLHYTKMEWGCKEYKIVKVDDA